MRFSKKVGRWIRLVGIILIVLGGLIVIQDLRAGVGISMNAYISLVVGGVAVLLARRSREEEEEGEAP